MDPICHMPLLLQPVYKEYIWGGDRLIHEFHRRLNAGIYAEACAAYCKTMMALPAMAEWVAAAKLEPDEIDELDAEFRFTLDAAASDGNHKCARYFTQSDDGLRQNWGGRNSVL